MHGICYSLMLSHIQFGEYQITADNGISHQRGLSPRTTHGTQAVAGQRPMHMQQLEDFNQCIEIMHPGNTQAGEQRIGCLV